MTSENEPIKTPLDDTFEPIDVAGFAEEQEKAKIKPLPDATWLFEIVDDKTSGKCFKIIPTGPNSKNPGTPMISFHCKVIDDNPEFNNRRVGSPLFMLKGAFFSQLIGDGGSKIGFVEIVRPSKKWDPKKKIRLLEKDGSSAYFSSFTGCKFAADTTIDLKDGEETGFNSMVNFTVFSG